MGILKEGGSRMKAANEPISMDDDGGHRGGPGGVALLHSSGGSGSSGCGRVCASAFFAAWRPYFLTLTFALLGVAFYLAYRTRAGACAPSRLCEQPRFARSSRA